MVWPEVEQASKNHRYELVLSGEKLTKRYEEKNELDEAIWSLNRLNFLEISQCPLIDSLPSKIENLVNLLTLTLTGNRLVQLPEQIGSLQRLRHLNLSYNQIRTIDDQFFAGLNELETLNLSNNALENLPCLSEENNRKLAVLNLSHNRLQSLASLSSGLEHLAHVDLSSNLFEDFPSTLLSVPSLKNLFFESNQLTQLPCQLSQLPKLKEIRFQSNPIKDNRLKKLIEQDKVKALLEYLTRQFNEQAKTSTAAPTPPLSKGTASKDNVDQTTKDLIRVLHFDQPGELKGKQITLLPHVTTVRPHLLSCIVHHVDLASPGHLKKFLTLQNELHDGVCHKRTLATIGTHDLSLIKGTVIYDARDPNDIELAPLGKGSKLISARDFYDQLFRDAEHERKLKKRNQLSGLHKYLTLLEGQSLFPYLSDEDGAVLSLPPLTNAERSKLSVTTRSVLIEISSSHSMDICRQVMDTFLRQIITHQFGEKQPADSHLRQILTLQQTRVLDDKGQLKCTFPSRTDLLWADISQGSIVIERLMP